MTPLLRACLLRKCMQSTPNRPCYSRLAHDLKASLADKDGAERDS